MLVLHKIRNCFFFAHVIVVQIAYEIEKRLIAVVAVEIQKQIVFSLQKFK